MSSILNQSVAPNGRPPAITVARARSSATPQDVSQNLPMSPSHGLNPLKPSLKLNYSSSSVTTGGPSWLHHGTNDVSITVDANSDTIQGSSTGAYHNFIERNDNFNELVPQSASNFVQSLLSNNKLNPIRDVINELDGFSLEKQTTLAVTVSSAVKLERKQINQITKKMQRLTGFSNLKLQNTIDPSLIAGFVIRYGSDETHMIDLSVKGQLAELAARIETSEQRRAELEQGWSFPN